MRKLFLLSFVLFNVFDTKAQGGFPDPTFGNNGYVTLPVFAGTAFQPDGKLIGIQNLPLLPNGISVSRYKTDGTLDERFGTGGTAVVALSAYPPATFRGVAVQNNGKIIISTNGITTPAFILGRFNTNGTPDASFDTDGFLLENLICDIQSIETKLLAVQADGKIIRSIGCDSRNQPDIFLIRRYNVNGTLDVSFQPAPGLFLRSILLQNDGKILLGGSSSLLLRLNSNLTLDSSFGVNGRAQFGSLPSESIVDLAVQNDGKIVAVAQNGRIFRFNTGGTLDPTFGTNGNVSSPFSITKVLTQADGKIITGGNYNQVGSNGHFILARYNPDGTFDLTFGYGGMSVITLAATPKPLEDMVIAGNRLFAYGSGYLAAFQLSSSTPTTLTNKIQDKAIAEKQKMTKLSVLATPNPATTHFMLRLQSNSRELLKIRIVDAFGRIIEARRNVVPNSTLTFGNGYRAGIYFAEVVQGRNKVITRVIKQ